MKKVLCLVAIMLSITIANAQPWLKNLPMKKSATELSLYDFSKAFNEYWKPYNVTNGFYYIEGKKVKAKGWKQFYRWYYNQEFKVDKKTGLLSQKSTAEAFSAYKKKMAGAQETFSGDWKSLGTNSSDGGYRGIGRVNCIAFHPTDNNTYWVGAPAGGIWVTTDNAESWTCLSDNTENLGVSDIIIPSDYETSKTIYIATGDRDTWDVTSVGVLKSTDGGTTWSETGLSFAPSDYNKVNKLLLHPTNNAILLAATRGGVYRTENGGADWTFEASNEFIDMEYKPGNFNTLYGAQDGNIFTSTDGGKNWTAKYESDGGRIELAVSPNQSSWVYAIVTDSEGGLGTIQKSEDSGATFTEVFSGATNNLLNHDINTTETGGQGWYDLSLAASIADANLLFVGGINTWSSKDGGKTWGVVSHWYGKDGTTAIHADKHNLVFRKNGDLFECNDGGIYASDNNGTDWYDLSNGLVISQIYKLGVSVLNEDETITGLQDNGTKLRTNNVWRDVYGGDGMECIIDYTDNKIQYGTYVNGEIHRTIDLWATESTLITPTENGDLVQGAWVTPYIIDPKDPKILYAGYSDVWKTTDRGDTWTKISDLSTTDKIRVMAIAPSDNMVIYIANHDNIWKTTNGGTDWTVINGSLPIANANITSIAVKSTEAKTLWVTFSGYNTERVFTSTDGGANWTDISAGLPQMPLRTIVENKLNGQLFVGAEVGIFTKEGTADWRLFSDGLPNVIVTELEFYYNTAEPAKTKLRAATYGRGLWETTLATVVETAKAGTAATTTGELCSNQPASLTLTDFFGTIQWQQSTDGTTNWTDIANATGSSYTSGNLNATVHYRAKVTYNNADVFSNTVKITVTTTPTASFNATVHNLRVVFENTSANARTYLWNFGDNSTSEAQSPEKTYSANGTFTVQLKAMSGTCNHSASKSVTVNATGINSITESSEFFTLFPNPVTENLTINFEEELPGNVSIEIFDLNAKKVFSLSTTNKHNELEISKLPKGIYQVHVSNKSKLFVQQIVKN